LNTKAVYAAGAGVAVIAIIIFVFLGNSNFNFNPTFSSNPSSNQTASNGQPLELSIKNVNATKLDNNNAQVQVTFNIHNPNRSTFILETIQYTVGINNFTMAVGNIGTPPEGFVAGSGNVFPVIGNSTLTLKDPNPPVSLRDNLIGTSWDNMVAGKATYVIYGYYSYRSTTGGLDASTVERDFKLTFHP